MKLFRIYIMKLFRCCDK